MIVTMGGCNLYLRGLVRISFVTNAAPAMIGINVGLVTKLKKTC